ncbi:hypothetical protein AB0G71_26985 [Streptomyces sp. NPDC020403]|uniref:hypothetical protein n=1 Tax=unclassified Streptomyces TaxID=2593676 RepID=UPI003411C8DB
MTAENEDTKNANGATEKNGAGTKAAAAKGRRTTASAGSSAKADSAVAASKATESAEEAGKAARSVQSGVRSAGEATKRAAAAGWDTGQQTVRSTAGKVASTATTAWTVVKNRKAIAAGATAGAVGLVGGAFALGRQTAKVHGGPITRLTGGRI